MPLRPMNREQIWLLPPTLDELVPPDHPARFVAEFVDALDDEGWAELGVAIEGERMGAPAYHPRALLIVWLYGFMTGVRSCRKLETACRDQIPYLWLTGWQRPDHNTLWRYYKRHRESMRHLLKRTVRTAISMDLVDMALQAMDGTKVAANASGDRTYDAEGLGRLLKRLDGAIAEMEAHNEGGEEESVVHLPQELSDREALRERVRQTLDGLGEGDGPRHANLTDADARLMKTRQGIVPAYNAQAMVSPVETDGESSGMLITGVEVVDEPVDFAQLSPMLERAEEMTGIRVDMTLADAGYHSGSNLEECARRGQRVVMAESQERAMRLPYHKERFRYDEESDSYICPEGRTLRFTRTKLTRATPMRLYRASGVVCRSCPAFGVCTRDGRHGRALEVGPNEADLHRHRVWMSTDEARRLYRRRKGLVEPVFGIIKEQQGARRFLLRGVANVAAEWTLLATTFNLRTLWRVWKGSVTSIWSREWSSAAISSHCQTTWPQSTQASLHPEPTRLIIQRIRPESSRQRFSPRRNRL